jgi:hypothetical protein
MKKVFRPAVLALALAAVAALTLAAVASAAYTSPKLTVSYAAGNVTRIVASAAVGDDATARAAIVIPNGTTINTTAAAGSKVGTARAQVSALALGGALLPLTGDVIVAPPGSIPAASVVGCTAGVAPQVTLLLVLQAAGQTINLPAYVIPTTGAVAALGSSQLVFCLPPPDLPVDKGGATFGAKFLSADLTLNGVFGPVTQGAWVGLWTPWQAGNGQVNAAGTVVSPALIAPGAVTLVGIRAGQNVGLTGKVTQGGTGFATAVQIWAATGKAAFRPWRVVRSKADGSFAVRVPKTAKQTSFQARVTAPGRAVPAVCAQFAAVGVPCVNSTVNGFTARSKVAIVNR